MSQDPAASPHCRTSNHHYRREDESVSFSTESVEGSAHLPAQNRCRLAFHAHQIITGADQESIGKICGVACWRRDTKEKEKWITGLGAEVVSNDKLYANQYVLTKVGERTVTRVIQLLVTCGVQGLDRRCLGRWRWTMTSDTTHRRSSVTLFYTRISISYISKHANQTTVERWGQRCQSCSTGW